MPRAHILRECSVQRTPRVQQLEGLFDLPPAQRSREEWQVSLPLEEQEWQIGLIVGPSGVGKSTIARELFGEKVVTGFEWDSERAVVDGFPKALSIKEVTGLLNAVGFSSPPFWLRPFPVLSTGQQFRVTLARALAEASDLCVVDEFTSVVDRTVAQIGSSAVAKAVRRTSKRFVAVTCHYDVLEWLQPDWVYEPHSDRFQWRCLQRRPDLVLSLHRVHHSAWKLFKGHHYLSASLNAAAQCFLGVLREQAVAFVAVLYQPLINRAKAWRVHRAVVLPDFQGVGIGNRMIEEVARLYLARGARFLSTDAHPATNQHRRKSPLWRCTRAATPYNARQGKTLLGMTIHSRGRLTTSWEFVGP